MDEQLLSDFNETKKSFKKIDIHTPFFYSNRKRHEVPSTCQSIYKTSVSTVCCLLEISNGRKSFYNSIFLERTNYYG